MTHTPAQIMQALLFEGSGALFSDPNAKQAWPVYDNKLPASPDQCAAVYDTAGTVYPRLLASKRTPEGFGIQIRTRSNTATAGWSRLFNLMRVLEAYSRKTLTVTTDEGTATYKIDTIQQTSNIISLGEDEQRRTGHTLNVILTLIGTGDI